MRSSAVYFIAALSGVLLMLCSILSLAEVNIPEMNSAMPVKPVFRLTSSAMVENGQFPYRYSYCQPGLGGTVQAAKDLSPPLSWTGAPLGTKSFVLIVSDFNSSAQVASHQTDYHWVLVNIPVFLSSLPEAVGSKGFVPGGKQPGATRYGDAGINCYNDILNSPDVASLQFLKNKVYAGIYGQYDGPCPFWGDHKDYRYVFTLYALDVQKLDLPTNGMFTAPEALKEMQGHILARSILTVRYVNDIAGLD